MKRTAQPQPADATRRIEQPAVRAVASVLLALHVAAVFVAPMSLSPGGGSELFRSLQRLFRPYLDVAYLNHGYGFFSPNPGSSYLIRYEVQTQDGRVVEGVLPDRKEHWPRLRYHRHFMLSSQASEWPLSLPESFARHLLRQHDGRSVRLQYVEHRLLSTEQVRQGMELDDPSTYYLVGTATIDEQGRADVRPLDVPQPLAPQPVALPMQPATEYAPVMMSPYDRAGGRR